MTDPISEMRSVMERFPDLTIDGLDGDKRPDFDARRADLLSPVALTTFQTARTWLELVPKRMKPNRRCSSYAVKHVIEKWTGQYVDNGSMIAAAVALDIEIARCPSGINAWLGIGARNWPE
jgi:hypothetical protein